MRNTPDSEKRKKRRLLFMIFILLLVVVSLCYLSYIIGRTGSGVSYTGKIVDTIVLSPDSGSFQSYLVNIVGYVRYEDGTPYPNGDVELRSDVLYTTTDQTGYFEFKDVPEGTHTISVVKNGAVLATCTVTVEKVSYVANAQIVYTGNGSYHILVPLVTISIDLNLVLNGDALLLSEDTISSPQITVSDGDVFSQIWTQTTSVDIFADRPGNSGVISIDGENVIAPGSNGKYIFKIQNPENFPTEYTVTLKETDENNPALPMRYRLLQGVSGSDYIGGNVWKTASEISLGGVLLSAGEDNYYTLEWRWDSASDSTDTALGMQTGNPVYILEIVVTAQF